MSWFKNLMQARAKNKKSIAAEQKDTADAGNEYFFPATPAQEDEDDNEDDD